MFLVIKYIQVKQPGIQPHKTVLKYTTTRAVMFPLNWFMCVAGGTVNRYNSYNITTSRKKFILFD